MKSRSGIDWDEILFYIGIQRIDLSLDLYGFGQSGDNAAVVFDVVKIKNSLLGVLEPFVEDLIAADWVFPHLRLHALKILDLVRITLKPAVAVKRLV